MRKKICFITFSLTAAILCVLAQAQSTPTPQVRFLYVIENAGSRTDYLSNPSDIFFDRERKELYVIDAGKHRILIFNPSGRFSAEIKEIGGIKIPVSIIVDEKGRLYLLNSQFTDLTILDYRGRLLDIYTRNELFGSDTIKPFKVLQNQKGDIFVLSTKTTLSQINMDTHKIEQLSLKINPSDPELKRVLDVTTDYEGNFYFGDMRPGQVVVFDHDGKYLKRIGEPGGGPRQISRPTGVAVDKKGRVFVVSTIRHMILCYDSDGNFLKEFGGLGKLPGYFYFPTKIVTDDENRLYVLESSLNRVQVFEVN